MITESELTISGSRARSAHRLAASPTAHRLEYLDTAGAILRNPIRIEDGRAVVPDDPGIGLEWDEEAVARYLVR